MTIVAGFSAASGTEVDDKNTAAAGHCAPDETRIRYDDFDGRSGSIEVRDANGMVLHARSISAFVGVIPPLMPDARILTERGEVAAKDICAGDYVVTRENGLQPVRQVTGNSYDWRALGLNPLLRPVKVTAGALGDGLPTADILLSPSQLLTVSLPGVAKAGEWLVRAIDLIGQEGVEQITPSAISYLQLLFSERQYLMVDGFWNESLPQIRTDFFAFENSQPMPQDRLCQPEQV